MNLVIWELRKIPIYMDQEVTLNWRKLNRRQKQCHEKMGVKRLMGQEWTLLHGVGVWLGAKRVAGWEGLGSLWAKATVG